MIKRAGTRIELTMEDAIQELENVNKKTLKKVKSEKNEKSKEQRIGLHDERF